MLATSVIARKSCVARRGKGDAQDKGCECCVRAGEKDSRKGGQGRSRGEGSKGMAVLSDLFVSAWGRQEGPQWGSPYLLFLGRGGIPSPRIFDRLASPAVSNTTGG